MPTDNLPMPHATRLRGSRFVQMLERLSVNWNSARVPPNDSDFYVLELREKGYSWGAIASKLGVSAGHCRSKAQKAARSQTAQKSSRPDCNQDENA